jgi:protein-L-isoaspartate(D-aspartate) O-methyltransferase
MTRRLAPALFLLAVLAAQSDPFTSAREGMVRDQIEQRGVRNLDVLRIMRATPRHEFVPANLQTMAYIDFPLAIGYGATISQPYVVALMTELLQATRESRVLEIGTGSGYHAAVLAQLVKRVYTIEIVAELAASARATLTRLGYSNVSVRQGDGYKGWPQEAPFDRMILTAAPPDVPQALIDQLAPGGRMVAPVGPTPFQQELIVIDKGRDGHVSRRAAGKIAFVPMKAGK